MERLSRVVWSEGMYLGPHHFQTQSRYFEDCIQFAISCLWPNYFGVLGCELDVEALRNGTVSVLHARGIFPDGLPFHMPECDPLPAPRNIADLFPPTRDELGVYLAIPARKAAGLNCALSNSESDFDQVRYIAETHSVHDENTGRDEKPVQLGRKNLRLILDTEASEGAVALPLAHIMRDGSGQFVLDPKFIPPCLRISASEPLLMMLRRLIDILEEKSSTISNARQRESRSLAEFSTQEIASFWFLHAVNASLPPLRHLYISKRGHPEELYLELSRLAGSLCTFVLDSHPRAVPLYDHENLGKCFEELDLHIRRHLETVIPTNCVSIPLKPVADYFYEGEVIDQRCLHRSRWVFAIQSPLGEAELISKTPQLVKICSSRFVGELVKRALAGLTLTHLPSPPTAISRRVESQYFSVSKAGPCWDHIVETKRVGVYVPGELPSPNLELLVVLESQDL